MRHMLDLYRRYIHRSEVKDKRISNSQDAGGVRRSEIEHMSNDACFRNSVF
jgi:hypothetical protein